MKKLLAGLICICLAFTGTGCGNAPKESSPTITDSTQTQIDGSTPPVVNVPDAVQRSMHAVTMVNVRQNTLAEDGTVIFTQAYQQISLMLNGVEAQTVIAADLQRRTAGYLSDTDTIISDARDAYTSTPEYWTPYFVDISYTPTRIDQSVMSLFCNYSVYYGGIHPSYVTSSVTYDLSSGRSLTLTDILTENCTSNDLFSLVSTALAPDAESLYYDYQDWLRDIFSVNLREISNWYFSHSGLNFHFAPYEIAPYSSGTIIASIPYEQLGGLLREAYFPTTQPEANGSLYAEYFLPDDTERFTFLAQVPLVESGITVLLHPDATVTDVRIETGEWSYDGTRFIPVSTVFAADAVSLGSGIVITADLSSDAAPLRLVYCSGGQEVSAFIVYDEAGDAILLAHG